MEKRDDLHNNVKVQFEMGKLERFNNFFDDFPVTRMAKHLRTNNTRMIKLIHNPGQLKVRDVHDIAHYYSIDFETLFRFLSNEYLVNKRPG